MVDQVDVPPYARAFATIAELDYTDAHRVEVERVPGLSGEEWARVILEDAPIVLRAGLASAWLSLGLRLGPLRSDRHVLGWEVRRSTPDYALLGADSRLGLAAELLVKPERTLLFCTFVRLGNPAARAVWSAIAPGHRRVVRHVLARGASRAVRADPAPAR
jgi:hypothetical protein